MPAVVLSGLVGGCGSGWVRRVPGGLLGGLVFWACCPHGAGGGGLVPGDVGSRAAATSGQALAAARPGRRRGLPALPVRPRAGPSGGERALGQVDAISRAWTRFRPGKRQPERRSPNQEHVHQPLGTLTRTRARSPEDACTRRSSSQPTVDDAGGQAASSPRGQQHVSTGHEDLREGDADAPTHTPAEEPPQPNLPQRPRQDTPGTRPRTPNPTTQRSTTRTRHPRSRAQQRAPPVLTTNKYRSREQ